MAKPTDNQTEKRGKGRPTVMTPEKEIEILAILSTGGSRNMAADYVRIGQTTLHDHIERDNGFYDRVKEAEAQGQYKHIKKISESEQWQASAWMLERKWPDEFGRRERLEHVSPDGSMSPKDPHELTDEELMKIAAGRVKPI